MDIFKMFLLFLKPSYNDETSSLYQAAPGLISASPFGGAHAFSPAFTIQQAAGQWIRTGPDTIKPNPFLVFLLVCVLSMK